MLILFTMIRGSISINTESSDTSFFKKLEKEVLGAFGKTIENSYMPCLTWGSSGQTTLWLLQEQMEHLLINHEFSTRKLSDVRCIRGFPG